MPQLLIDTDTTDTATLRDTVVLLNAIISRKGLEVPAARPNEDAPAPKPEEVPASVVFAANRTASVVSIADGAPLTAASAPVLAATGEAAATVKKPRKPRTPKPPVQEAPPAAPAVPLPPEAPVGAPAAPSVPSAPVVATPAVLAPSPTPLSLVGDTPPPPVGVSFRDVMQFITSNLAAGKLTNAEVNGVCAKHGLSTPADLPAMPGLNAGVIADLRVIVAGK